MKKLTKLINTQFHPTLYSYGLGGRVILDPGGFIPLETDKLLAWGQGQVNKANAMKGGSPNINGQAIGQAGNIIGGTIDAIAASKNTKPYAKKSLAGGAVKGAAQGASAGLMFGPVGAAIGGVVGAGAGLLTSKLGNDASRNAYINETLEQQKQQTIANLPGQPEYISTFARGGKLHHNKPPVLRQSALDLGLFQALANGGEILDRVSSFDTGGLHSENGGIPIGQNAMVEKGEYMYKTKSGQKYIFSNKF